MLKPPKKGDGTATMVCYYCGATNDVHVPDKREAAGKAPKSGCYIATAVYGSYDCPSVWVLRRYRDNTLKQSASGRAFIKLYYAISPKLIKIFGRVQWFNGFWTKRLDKKVKRLKARGFADTPYKD
jgi:hypothetical protein